MEIFYSADDVLKWTAENSEQYSSTGMDISICDYETSEIKDEIVVYIHPKNEPHKMQNQKTIKIAEFSAEPDIASEEYMQALKFARAVRWKLKYHYPNAKFHLLMPRAGR